MLKLIRKATKNDINKINELGAQLHSNFIYTYHIETEVENSFSMNEAYWHLSDDMEKVFVWLICLTFVLLLVKNPIEIAKRFSCNKKWFVCILLILFYSIMRITLFSEFLYFQFFLNIE